VVFSDYEQHKPKKTYSHLGGCFYSCKMAVLEALAEQQKQAGAIILREAVSGYVPLGVFNVRENVRSAMKQPALELEDSRSVCSYLSDKFTLPLSRFEEVSVILRNIGRKRQTSLTEFL
jgi:DNA repair protein NreA